MDIVHATILASLVGAGLFFVGGYLARALRRPVAGQAGQATDALERDLQQQRQQAAHQEARAEALERSREEAEARAARAVQQLESTRAERDREAKARQELAQQVTQLQHSGSELQGAAEQVKQLAGRAKALEAERGRLAPQAAAAARHQQEGQRLRQQVKELEGKVAELTEAAAALDTEQTQVNQRQPDVEAVRRLGQLEGDAKQLKAEASRSRQQLTQAQQELAGARAKAERVSEVEQELARVQQELEQVQQSSVPAEEVNRLRKKQRDMLVKAQMMQQHVSEMERHAEENALLKQHLVRFDDVNTEAVHLRRRTEQLESKLFAAGIALEEKKKDTTKPAEPGALQESSRGAAMDRQIAGLLGPGSTSSAVLSDLQGLLLASSGDGAYHEGLAVISSVIGDVGVQSRDMLPMAGLRRVHLSDENGVHLVSRMFDHGDQPLALTVVGRDPQDDDKLDDLVASLSRLIEAQGQP